MFSRLALKLFTIKILWKVGKLGISIFILPFIVVVLLSPNVTDPPLKDSNFLN
jgi:hypothetical protein